MGKRSKSKTPGEMQDKTAVGVEEEKQASLGAAAKKPTSEIDDIFAVAKKGGKKKKPETEKAKEPNENRDGTRNASWPSTWANKPSSGNDESAAGKKRKKPDTGKAKKLNEGRSEDPNKLKRKKKDRGIQEDGGFGDLSSKSKSKMRTQDGFTIYSEEELGINKADAGNTPLCPFDCSCCF